jgi:hypothetical protein
VQDLGLQVRLSLPTAERKVFDAKVAGIGFEDCSLAELKGVPRRWLLYSVVGRSREGEQVP